MFRRADPWQEFRDTGIDGVDVPVCCAPVFYQYYIIFRVSLGRRLTDCDSGPKCYWWVYNVSRHRLGYISGNYSTAFVKKNPEQILQNGTDLALLICEIEQKSDIH